MVLSFMAYRLNIVKPGTKIHYGALSTLLTPPMLAIRHSLDDLIPSLELKLLVVVLGVTWQGCRSSGDDSQVVHFEACFE